MKLFLPTLTSAVLLSLSPSSRAAVSLFVLKDAYDINPANPQVYRYDGAANLRSGTQNSITTRTMGHGYSSDIAIDEQGRFYFVSGLPTDTSTKQIWYWNSVADWAANTNGGLLGQRNTTFQVSGFSVYNNELYFLEGNPNAFGNKTLRKWASATSWANGDAGTTVGTRSIGTGLGFEIDAGGAVWFLDGSSQTSTSGTLYRWNSINDFLNNTNGDGNGGAFNFTFSGTADQIAGLAVPEPSSSLLFLTSLATLALFRRRSA
ncbi:MAG: PEP-CTERM sorting domain-containing protein [Verrucomicrobia bacterium]|nr:PEP-CTERM sorting domain-containing protein [Verrucomicrobiota bacterium]NBU68438.1 PEP-CTERM sorting domain-containing protein [Verrucomicrobiota bacterium]